MGCLLGRQCGDKPAAVLEDMDASGSWIDSPYFGRGLRCHLPLPLLELRVEVQKMRTPEAHCGTLREYMSHATMTRGSDPKPPARQLTVCAKPQATVKCGVAQGPCERVLEAA